MKDSCANKDQLLTPIRTDPFDGQSALYVWPFEFGENATIEIFRFSDGMEIIFANPGVTIQLTRRD
jgi:hypothetical protein